MVAIDISDTIGWLRSSQSIRGNFEQGEVMKLEHVAIWAEDIDKLRSFYETYFCAHSNKKYINPEKKYSSYFLSFESGARLEIMQMGSVIGRECDYTKNYYGMAHISFSVGSKENVDEVTSALQKDGYTVLDGPRKTGDGYYESAVLDPEENRLEITI